MSSAPPSPTFGDSVLEAMSLSFPSLAMDQHSACTLTPYGSFDQDLAQETNKVIVQAEDSLPAFNNYGDPSFASELFLVKDWGHNVSYDNQKSPLQHHDQQQMQLLTTPQGLSQSSLAIGQELAYNSTLESVEQLQQLSQLQSETFPSFQAFTPQTTSMAPAASSLTSPFTSPFTPPFPSDSTTPLLCPETAGYSNYFDATYNQITSQPSSAAVYGTRFEHPLDIAFSGYRSPTFDRLSSPDGCLSPLSTSESPSDQGYFEWSDADAHAISNAFSGSSLSGSSSSAPPSPALQTEAFAYCGHHPPGLCDTLTGPFGDLGVSPLGSPTSTMAGPYGIASPKGKIQSRRTQQLAAGSASPAQVSSTSSFLSTTPTQSSPLKQQFSSFESDGNQSDNDDDDDDDHECEETGKRRSKDEKPKKKQKKRVRRDTDDKPKTPKLILRCDYPDCVVTCSSHPSLVRHREAHKWKGQYTPVRCAACLRSLSNEFSVQRHIMRSKSTSRCRKMRAYNMMGSDTLILYTVRFHPERGHGKKTVHVDLEKMQEKYP